MKIYTKTGDNGQTGLYAGPRVDKDSPRIEAYGEVDELNSALGVARAGGLPGDLDGLFDDVQNDLFAVGAELATPQPEERGTHFIDERAISRLEDAIDRYEANLPALREFILPGGSLAAAHLHLARGICRRAERRVVALTKHSPEPISMHLVVYLNRLSDLLFVAAREANRALGAGDAAWQKPAP